MWTTIKYGTLIAAGLATTGTFIYYETVARPTVQPEDFIEIYQGVIERCMATQYTTNKYGNVVVTNKVRTWVDYTNAPKWYNYSTNGTRTTNYHKICVATSDVVSTNMLPYHYTTSYRVRPLTNQTEYATNTGMRMVWSGFTNITITGSLYYSGDYHWIGKTTTVGDLYAETWAGYNPYNNLTVHLYSNSSSGLVIADYGQLQGLYGKGIPNADIEVEAYASWNIGVYPGIGLGTRARPLENIFWYPLRDGINILEDGYASGSNFNIVAFRGAPIFEYYTMYSNCVEPYISISKYQQLSRKILEMLEADNEDFLGSETWYVDDSLADGSGRYTGQTNDAGLIKLTATGLFTRLSIPYAGITNYVWYASDMTNTLGDGYDAIVTNYYLKKTNWMDRYTTLKNIRHIENSTRLPTNYVYNYWQGTSVDEYDTNTPPNLIKAASWTNATAIANTNGRTYINSNIVYGFPHQVTYGLVEISDMTGYYVTQYTARASSQYREYQINCTTELVQNIDWYIWGSIPKDSDFDGGSDIRTYTNYGYAVSNLSWTYNKSTTVSNAGSSLSGFIGKTNLGAWCASPSVGSPPPGGTYTYRNLEGYVIELTNANIRFFPYSDGITTVIKPQFNYCTNN